MAKRGKKNKKYQDLLAECDGLIEGLSQALGETPPPPDLPPAPPDKADDDPADHREPPPDRPDENRVGPLSVDQASQILSRQEPTEIPDPEGILGPDHSAGEPGSVLSHESLSVSGEEIEGSPADRRSLREMAEELVSDLSTIAHEVHPERKPATPGTVKVRVFGEKKSTQVIDANEASSPGEDSANLEELSASSLAPAHVVHEVADNPEGDEPPPMLATLSRPLLGVVALLVVIFIGLAAALSRHNTWIARRDDPVAPALIIDATTLNLPAVRPTPAAKKWAQALQAEGRKHLGVNRLSAAASLFRQAIAYDPSDPVLRFEYAKLVRADHFRQFRDHLDRLTAEQRWHDAWAWFVRHGQEDPLKTLEVIPGYARIMRENGWHASSAALLATLDAPILADVRPLLAASPGANP
jgi:hypothetical protein